MEHVKRSKVAWMAGVWLAALTGLAGQAAATGSATESVGTQHLGSLRANGQVIYIIGSKLMQPFAEAVMERLATKAGLPPAIMANEGSARGIEVFCEGLGLQYPDVVAVSRRIRGNELDLCQSNGITDILEIQVGYEATAVISRADDQTYPLTLNALYLAIARELPEGFDFNLNRYGRWSQVDSRLPDTEIRFVIPSPALGGRAFLEDQMLQRACRSIFEIKSIFSADERVKQCISLREDGRIIELDKPFEENVLKQLQSSPPGTLAVVPMRFASAHLDVEKVQPLDGVLPTTETVADHSYQFVRPLYFYVKKAHVKNYLGDGPVNGLREFITEVTRESAIGPDGYLAKIGVFPMNDELRQRVRQSNLQLTPMVRR